MTHPTRAVALNALGVPKPTAFPQALDVDDDGTDADDSIAAQWEWIENNPHSALIYAIYKSLNNIYGFHAAYVYQILHDHSLDLLETSACNIDTALMALAACKAETDENFAANAREFRYESIRNYEQWPSIVRNQAFRAGIPLRAELSKMTCPGFCPNISSTCKR